MCGYLGWCENRSKECIFTSPQASERDTHVLNKHSNSLSKSQQITEKDMQDHFLLKCSGTGSWEDKMQDSYKRPHKGFLLFSSVPMAAISHLYINPKHQPTSKSDRQT